MEKRWHSGDPVVLRNTGFFVGAAWGTPHVVIEDRSDLLVLYRPEHSIPQEYSFVEGKLRDRSPTRMDMLRLMFPQRWYAVELFFDTGSGAAAYAAFAGEGRFRGWKINIEAPFRRTEQGFDTTDHFLDIVMGPDYTLYWKDQDAVQEWLERGAYLQEEVDRLYEAGREAERLILAREPPFDGQWTDWRPASPYEPVPLPREWHLLPGVETTGGLERRWDWHQNVS